MERQRLMFSAALACAALLAGCGSGGSSSSSSTAASTGSTAAKTSSQTSSNQAPVAGSTEVKAAVAECKSIIHGETKLPSGAKEKLEGACAAAAKGDTAAVKKAAREVCEEVIGKSSVPSGAAKEGALAACRK
jgi:ABC-type phosphate transport system substrate-binding protein